MNRLPFWLFLIALIGGATLRAESLPPKPARYFNDYARLVPADVAQGLNTRLAQFERDTTSQIVVAIFPKMNSASSVEDFTVRTAQSWGVGQKGRNNGAVLFVFVQDRQAYIQVGYGLEGALPDAVCFQIIDQQIKPRFRAGDYAGGLTAAVNSMIAATRGEYKAALKQAPAQRGTERGFSAGIFLLFLVVMLMMGAIYRSARGKDNPRRGRWRGPHSGGWFGGGGFGGGGSSGGSSFGGFSGGGGSFGGGGAGGKW